MSGLVEGVPFEKACLANSSSLAVCAYALEQTNGFLSASVSVCRIVVLTMPLSGAVERMEGPWRGGGVGDWSCAVLPPGATWPGCAHPTLHL